MVNGNEQKTFTTLKLYTKIWNCNIFIIGSFSKVIFSLVLRKTLISFLLLHPYLYNRQSNQIIFIWNLMFHYNQGRKSRPNKYVLVESKYWKKIVVEATNFQHLTWKWRCRFGDELLGSMSPVIKSFWNKVRLKKQQARIL